jgi:hypothetical protein
MYGHGVAAAREPPALAAMRASAHPAMIGIAANAGQCAPGNDRHCRQ